MNIYRIKADLLRSQKGRCAFCGAIIDDSTPCDLSHLIPQRKWCLKKWGAEIIHHPLNMKVTCHNDVCNSGVQLSPNKTLIVEEHIKMIQKEIDNA